LALRREEISAPEDLRFVVPGKALSEVSKILGERMIRSVCLSAKKHILFELIILRFFPDFWRVNLSITPLPSQRRYHKGRVQTRAFIESVERASLLISDRIKSPLRVKFEGNSIASTCSTALGKAYDRIAAAVEGAALEIGFNKPLFVGCPEKMPTAMRLWWSCRALCRR
jgi:DNA polymerase-3 subunit beta